MRKGIQIKNKRAEKAMAIGLAAVNIMPMTMPAAALVVQAEKGLPSGWGLEMIENGGKTLDRLIFSTAHAASTSGTTITSTVSVSAGETSTDDTINNGGWQRMYGGATSGALGATATSTTVNSGGSQYVYGGKVSGALGATATNTTLNSFGWQFVFGGDVSGALGATATSTTINSVGSQFVFGGEVSGALGATAMNTTINDGGSQIVRGGKASGALGATATSTTVNDGGSQNVHGGEVNGALGAAATSTTVNGGSQTVWGGMVSGALGATATNTTLNNGGSQLVFAGEVSGALGGTATNTTINGGEQFLFGGIVSGALGGTAVGTTINNGGYQMVGGGISGGLGATATSTTINSGGIQDVGGGLGATAIDTTVNSGGKIIYGDGIATFGGTLTAEKGAEIRNDYSTEAKVNIEKMAGSADFYINTDIANGKSDMITIKEGTPQNGIGINYDPCFETGETVAALGGGVTFADVPDGAAFTPKETEYGAYTFTPTITSASNGATTSYQITEIGASKASEAGEAGADIMVGTAMGMRIETNNVMKRMGELRHIEAETGVWARVYSGETKSDINNRESEVSYNAIQVGYDKKIGLENGTWFAGGAIGYLDAADDMVRTESDIKSTSLALYGTWLNNSGHYVDIVAKQSRINSDYTSYLDNPRKDRLNGDYDNWGTALSVEYGYRNQLGGGVYVEPQVEISTSRLNSASYRLSDGTRAQNDAVNSLIGRLGIAYGKDDGKRNYYAKISAVREFTAEAKTTMQTGRMDPISVERDMTGTWLEYALGLTYKIDETKSGYMELMAATGSKIETPWQVNAGMRWSF